MTWESWHQVKPSSQRLTIFDKMEILKYAQEVTDKHVETMKAARAEQGQTQKKTKSSRRTWLRGLNLQSVCAKRFPEKLKKIKVCQLRKQAERQKWHLLTEAQQKNTVQLSDQMKLALGLEANVKGWKSLPPDKVSERIQNEEELPRWKVPAKVLEAGRRGECMYINHPKDNHYHS